MSGRWYNKSKIQKNYHHTVRKLDQIYRFITQVGRVYRSNYLIPLSLSPGVLRCRWCFGAWSIVLLVGLLDVRRRLLLGQVTREVVPWVDGAVVR